MNKFQQFGRNYMCKKSENNVNNLWVACWQNCEKVWVDFVKKNIVGKNLNFYTFRPTFFKQAFSTHNTLLNYAYSPVSTTPITTTNYIKEKK